MSSDETDSDSELVAENYERFKKNLEKKYDLKYEEYHIDADGERIKPVREWKWCGESGYTRFNDEFSINDVGVFHSTPHYRYFYMYFHGNPPKIAHEDYCVCGVEIKHNHYITDDEGRILVIGSECIRKFITKTGRICEDCGAKHKCRKQNKCTKCAKQIIKNEKENVKRDKQKKKLDNLIQFMDLEEGINCDKCDKAKQRNYTRCFDCNTKYKAHPMYRKN